MRVRGFGFTAIAAVLLVSCARPSTTLVSGLPEGSALTLPQGWQMVDLKAQSSDLTLNNPLNVGPEVVDARAFSPDPNELSAGKIIFDGTAPYGFLHIRQFSQEQLAETSIRDLRDGVFPFDETLAKTPAFVKVITQEPLTGGNFGEHLVFSVRLPSAATSDGVEKSVTIDQTVLLDPATQQVSVLFVACDSDCFEEFQPQIDGIVNSWRTTI
jgi:hypothetical protein